MKFPASFNLERDSVGPKRIRNTVVGGGDKLYPASSYNLVYEDDPLLVTKYTDDDPIPAINTTGTFYCLIKFRKTIDFNSQFNVLFFVNVGDCEISGTKDAPFSWNDSNIPLRNIHSIHEDWDEDTLNYADAIALDSSLQDGTCFALAIGSPNQTFSNKTVTSVRSHATQVLTPQYSVFTPIANKTLYGARLEFGESTGAGENRVFTTEIPDGIKDAFVFPRR